MVIRNKELIAKDVSENEIWNIVNNNNAKIVVTAIGGQGHIFGRGNQQISPRIIRKVEKDGIMVIATKEKLLSLKNKVLLIDTGDMALDNELTGYKKVIVGFNEYTICKVDIQT
ncbi:MAG: hypothetical protein K9L30_05160 [Desulfobacterales bacterium]|nr:hypothetical protein [Desulfobacterales bacterium]